MLRTVLSLLSWLLILPFSTVEARPQGKDAHPSPPSHEAGDPHLLSSGRTLQDSAPAEDYIDGDFSYEYLGEGLWRDDEGNYLIMDTLDYFPPSFNQAPDPEDDPFRPSGCVFDCGTADKAGKLAGGVIAAIVIASILCCCVPCIAGGVVLCCFAGAKQRLRRGAAAASPAAKAEGSYAYGHAGPPRSAAVAPEAPVGVAAGAVHSGKLAHAAPRPLDAPPGAATASSTPLV